MKILPTLTLQTSTHLLPQDCLLCGVTSADLLCLACADSLPALPPLYCPCCALPTPDGGLCGDCLKSPPQFDATIARYQYGFPLDRLAQALKFQQRLALAGWLGRALLGAIPNDLKAHYILPLPLSRQRLRQRGFNQALEIARVIARERNIPMPFEWAERRRDTLPQSTLPWDARRRNVRRAFACYADFSGQSVWVVDDVMTTGASLDVFAAELKRHGAHCVTNLVVARALRHS